jgi:hypothetical protein
VAATVLLLPDRHPLLFGLSGLIAFANLFSSQFLCALDGCRVNANPVSRRDPAHTARLIFAATSIAGSVILIYALADLYLEGG